MKDLNGRLDRAERDITLRRNGQRPKTPMVIFAWEYTPEELQALLDSLPPGARPPLVLMPRDETDENQEDQDHV